MNVNTLSSLTQSQVQEGTFATRHIRSKSKHTPVPGDTDQEPTPGPSPRRKNKGGGRRGTAL